jgi:sialate O-acetylesterase
MRPEMNRFGFAPVPVLRAGSRAWGVLERRSLVAMLIGLIGCARAMSASADVTLSGMFSDNMVLQREMPVKVWGKAKADEAITVAIAGQTVSARAAKDGRWQATLAPMKAGGPFEMVVIGNNTNIIRNVLIGEVWVCAGQSNMKHPLVYAKDAQKEADGANYPQIRLLKSSTVASMTSKPQEDTSNEWNVWLVCNPQTVPWYSGLAYLFGRDMHTSLNVPVGLILCAWNGASAEVFTSRETFESNPKIKPILDRSDREIAEYQQKLDEYLKAVADWRAKADSADAEGKPVPPNPLFPSDPRRQEYPWTATRGYNAMIAPMTSFAIRGVIWYQGESNTLRPNEYADLFKALIQGWRKAWGEGDFPFIFVQLPNFREEKLLYSWALLREAQAKALELPNTAMAVAIDVGESHNIHPPNKQDVAKRLSLAARAIAYHQDLVSSGPMYEAISIKGDAAVISFKHVGGCLVTREGAPVVGFEIAGKDKKYLPAEARIDGATVVVRNKDISEPVAVRYAWDNDPKCSLYNKEGLPAAPFRTDTWEIEGTGKK